MENAIASQVLEALKLLNEARRNRELGNPEAMEQEGKAREFLERLVQAYSEQSPDWNRAKA